MTSSLALQLTRLLSLARYRRVAVTISNQEPGQLAGVPELVRSLRTNAAIHAFFRSSLQDARDFAHALPIPPNDQKTRQALIEELTRLEQRSFYLWPKPLRAQRVRSPRIDLDALRRAADSLSPELRDRIRRGTVSVPRDELQDLVDRDRRHRPRQAPRPMPFLVPPQANEDPSVLNLG